MKRGIWLFVLIYLGLTLPAGAATYNYYLQAGAVTTGFPTLNAWSVSWQTNSLTPPSCTAPVPAPVYSGAPISGYTPSSAIFCWSGGIAYFSVNWTLGGGPSGNGGTIPGYEITYSATFSATDPPISLGVFVTTASGEYIPPPSLVPDTEPFNASVTLTISKYIWYPPVPRWSGSIIRVSLTAGPVTPAPGTPVEAIVGFVDVNGNPIGQYPPAQIVAGEVTSFELATPLSLATLGMHSEVVPVVTAPNGQALPPLQLTAEVRDSVTALGAMLTSMTGLAPPPALVPQGLAGGQTMRLTATAFPPTPCNVTLGFANGQGVAVVPSVTVNLSPGQSQSLDLTSAMLNIGLGTSVEVQPMAVLQSPVGVAAGAGTSACMIASDVFDPITGRTSTYQAANMQ